MPGLVGPFHCWTLAVTVRYSSEAFVVPVARAMGGKPFVGIAVGGRASDKAWIEGWVLGGMSIG